MAYAERKGESFTGVDWQFYKFGPWALDVFSRIDPALETIGAEKRALTSAFSEDDYFRYAIQHGPTYETLEKDIPITILGKLKKYVHEFTSDTPSLLHHVYQTKPMLSAAPGEFLDLSVGHQTQIIHEGQPEPEEALSNNAKKRRAQHTSALFEIKPTSINQRRKDKTLPVAALPENKGESYGVYRLKKRPLVILSSGGNDVPKALKQGKPNWQTAPTVIACPYYGADDGGERAGFKAEFVERICRCEYPQFVYDMLPLRGAKESILRLDHLQPIGRHHDAIEFTPHCLTEDALEVLDEWLWWLLMGYPEKEGTLLYLREEMLKLS